MSNARGSRLELCCVENAWFFAKVTGVRRSQDRTLIRQAMRNLGGDQRSSTCDPDRRRNIVRGPRCNGKPFIIRVIASAPHDLLQLAKLLEAMAEDGTFWVLNEFSNFNRKGYEEFCSYLPGECGRLSPKAETVKAPDCAGCSTEMTGMLDDRPRFNNRVTGDTVT